MFVRADEIWKTISLTARPTKYATVYRVIDVRVTIFTFEFRQWRYPRLGLWKRYPYRAQWYPPSRSLVHETVKHRQYKPIKGWVYKGCIRERAVVITRNCVKFKFLLPHPQGLASWSFEPWRFAKEDIFKRCAKKHFSISTSHNYVLLSQV